jgi:hypothetical protein
MVWSNVNGCGFVNFLCVRVGLGIMLVKRKTCGSGFLFFDQ